MMHCLSWNGGHVYFHRTVRDRTATVWRRCSVAVDIVVGFVGLALRGVRLLGRIFLGKKFWAQKNC